MMYEMKPEYYTGIELIDEEHQKLFDYANEAYELLREDFTPDKYDNIAKILEDLREYTKKHFSDEEAYMESIQYKRLFTQKIQHQQFIEKLDQFDLAQVNESEDQDSRIQEILDFLTNWLVDHILHVDGQIGK